MPQHFSWLRTNQQKIFKAIGYHASFLKGPPGTGKTTTLGALLAEYMAIFPNKRILLLSTTNLAVDQALVAVDKSLDHLTDRKKTEQLRKRVFRVGNNFISKYYDDRRYLLPLKDPKLIDELKELESNQPLRSDIEAYAKWREAIDLVREKIKSQSMEVLENSSLIAMTTTRAIYTLSDLKDVAPFDMVIFDESSQVGLAFALMLAPLGKFCLFAGDPQQLSPIARSNQKYAQEWLGRSVFSLISDKNENVVFLNEQSRMTHQICDLVSHLFYEGKLIVAEDVKYNENWVKERKLSRETGLGETPVLIVEVDTPATWSRKYQGPIRYDSAKVISELLENMPNLNDTVVLTPFRAQRTLINTFLKKEKIKTYARTVHRSQGSEFHTVIFDPVDPSNRFLMTENAKRLINVALSRAKARLVILMHKQDLNNEVFDQIFNIVNSKKVLNDKKVKDISEYLSKPNWEKEILGELSDLLWYMLKHFQK